MVENKGVYEIRSRVDGHLLVAWRETEEEAISFAAKVESRNKDSIAEVNLIPFGVWSDEGRTPVLRSSRGDV